MSRPTILKDELEQLKNFPWLTDVDVDSHSSFPDIQGLRTIILRSNQDLFSGDHDCLMALNVLRSPLSLSQLLEPYPISRASYLQWVINYLFYYRTLDVAHFFLYPGADNSPSYVKSQHLQLSLNVSPSKFYRDLSLLDDLLPGTANFHQQLDPPCTKGLSYLRPSSARAPFI